MIVVDGRLLGHVDGLEIAPEMNGCTAPIISNTWCCPLLVRLVLPMMGAVQPFISGAISKTVNVPKKSIVEEIVQAYLESWKLGAKAISIYRDGSKRTQPLNTSKDKPIEEVKAVAAAAVAAQPQPVRRRLPDERRAITHKFDIGGPRGLHQRRPLPDGRPGELFITMAKEGSTVGGLMDAFGTAISMGLQYGVPLEVLVNKFAAQAVRAVRLTKNPEFADRQEHRRLHLPLDGDQVHVARGAVGRGRQHPRPARAPGGSRSAGGSGGGAGVHGQRPEGGDRLHRRGNPEPGRCAALLDLRLDHDPERQLLQVRELRDDQRLRLGRS